MALQYLQKSYENVVNREKEQRTQQSEKEKLAREQMAAQEAGYTHGVPPAVAAQQVKNKAKDARLEKFGFGGSPNDPLNLPNAENGTTPYLSGIQGNQSSNSETSPSFQTSSPFKKFSKDQLAMLTGVEDREIAEGAKAELKFIEEDERRKFEKSKEDRKEQVKFHQETQKFDEQLIHNSQIAKKQIQTIKDVKEAIQSGNVKPTSFANIFKGFGKLGDKIAEAALNKDEATLIASVPQLLEGWKQVFGVRLSDADLNLLQDKLPSLGKTPEANLSVVKVLEKYGELTLLREQIARDIKKNNKGLRPLGYVDQIEQRFDEMTVPIKVISPVTGKTIEIPAFKVSDALKSGAKLPPQTGTKSNEL